MIPGQRKKLQDEEAQRAKSRKVQAVTFPAEPALAARSPEQINIVLQERLSESIVAQFRDHRAAQQEKYIRNQYQLTRQQLAHQADTNQGNQSIGGPLQQPQQPPQPLNFGTPQRPPNQPAPSNELTPPCNIDLPLENQDSSMNMFNVLGSPG